METKIVYALYDSRYTDNPDRASCYSVADSLEEAKEEKESDWTDAVIVKETLKKVGKNKYEVLSSEIINF
jgi:hypothetical protein